MHLWALIPHNAARNGPDFGPISRQIIPEASTLRTLLLVSIALTLGVGTAACSSNGNASGANLVPPGQGTANQRSIGPTGVWPYTKLHGWILPDKSKKPLLYVSDEAYATVNIYSLPSYSQIGQISGLYSPEGITTDKKGNLYVSSLHGYTVTVYKQGQTTPFLTLTDSNGPDDVAIAKNDDVLVSDVAGGVDVYQPGQTMPFVRLTSGAILHVNGVGVDASNNVYAAGQDSRNSGVVVEYANMSGGGTNLGLKGLTQPAGVLIDNHGNIVVSDFSSNLIDIYAPGATAPSSTISVNSPTHIGLNNRENRIYAPQGNKHATEVLTYPGGSVIKTIAGGYFLSGAARSPAPVP
ncbi:MAG TPA: hypothetical protein VIW73_13160 [Candidatus Cybelea sp.]